MVHVSRGRLPIPGLGPHEGGNVDFGILAFQNVEPVLSPANDEQMKSAAGLLAEVAHSVGNPVAALRAAGELLDKAAKANCETNRGGSGDWSMVQSLCSIVVEESEKLEKQLRFFLDTAAQNPERLREFTRHAAEWAGKLSMDRGDES